MFVDSSVLICKLKQPMIDQVQKQLQNALVDLLVTQCIKIVIDWVWLDWSGKYLAILYDAQTLLALSLCFMTWSQIFSLSLSQYIDK